MRFIIAHPSFPYPYFHRKLVQTDILHEYLQGKKSKGSGTEQTSSLCGLGSSTSELRERGRGGSGSAVAGRSSSVSSAGDEASNAASSRLDGAGHLLSSGAGRLGGSRGQARDARRTRGGQARDARRSSGGCRCDGRAGCGCAFGDLNGHTGLLASLLDRGDGGGLFVGLAGRLYAGLYGAEELSTLLAVAGEVGQAAATVGGEGTDEAVQLESVSWMETAESG